MPIYEYECTSCGERFELRRGIADEDNDIVCPGCGTAGPRRLFSAFATTSPGSAAGGSGGSCAPRGGFT